LVGGSSNKEGNVFAINSKTGVDGPVCDDEWDIIDVRWVIFFIILLHAMTIYSPTA
jgi:hypothetical protein